MGLTMGDDTVVGYLPMGFDAYAGYVDGPYANFTSLCLTFAHCQHLLSISTQAAPNYNIGADCLDVEQYDANPWDAPGFVTARSGLRVVYMSQSNVQTVVNYLNEASVPRSRYKLWSAHYNQGPHICGPSTCGCPVQCDGTQWYTGTFDQSLLSDNFFDMLPQEDDMLAKDENSNYYRLSVYTPDEGQAPNTTVEQWREIDAADGKAAEAAGVFVYGPSTLALWEIHQATPAAPAKEEEAA